MDIPAHILDAVHTATNESQSPTRLQSMSTRSKKSLRGALFADTNPHSSAEDISSTSDSDPDNDYQTDFTTLACSSDSSNPEDMQPDDVEDFRDREYPQLIGKTYLDHGGTTLYAKSLVEEFSADLISNLYGNPHSASSPSALSGHRVDSIRERALRFFNADPEHYDLVFVANATAAIKLVIECFKDHAAVSNTPVWYGYHRDAHTSIVGVRESTKMHRCFTSDEEVDIWINSGGLGGPRARQLGLFAYPGQSNMTGRRLPLSWPGRIRKSFHKAPTYTLLDAAALASTAPLDLSDPATAPDFVALSFYKIFGFPNIGALIVRKDSAHVLQNRKYFGGGTVEMIIAINDTWHAKKEDTLHDRLEDGTLPFHSIISLDHAMNVHERLYGPNPMKFISHHTAQLGRQLYEGISTMKHSNGLPVCRIYKEDSSIYGDPSVQGATIALNVQLADGTLIGFAEVEEAADSRNIFVRSGSLCNPGGVATYLGWSPAEMKAAHASGHRCSNPTQIILGKPTGVVRVSLGAMNIASDVQTFIKFLREEYVDKQSTVRARPSLQQAQPPQLPRMASSQSAPESFGLSNSLPTLSTSNTPWNISSVPLSGDSVPSTAASGNDVDFGENVPLSALPNSTGETGDAAERPKNPPFIPADYVKMRKPWEAEMRKQQYANVNMEIKVRELEDASMFSKNSAPSVKARKFGRSMVNLLRTKSHATDGRPPMPTPTSPLPASADQKIQNASSSQRSRRSIEKNQFQSNVDALGM